MRLTRMLSTTTSIILAITGVSFRIKPDVLLFYHGG
jgi:hypothetical protein